jgi:hypothetical protein
MVERVDEPQALIEKLLRLGILRRDGMVHVAQAVERHGLAFFFVGMIGDGKGGEKEDAKNCEAAHANLRVSCIEKRHGSKSVTRH